MRTSSGSLLALVITVMLAACGGTGDDVVRATALPTVPADLRPVDSPTATPTPTPSVTASPTPTPAPSTPTDSIRARFVADYAPEGANDVEHVAVDLDGQADGIDELLFAYLDTQTGTARLDVAAWTDEGYQVVYNGRGAEGTAIERLLVDDINADGAVEVAVFLSTRSGTAMSLWRASGARSIEPAVAQGGCAGGTHNYGPVGARLENRTADPGREIVVDCDAGDTDVYAWRRDAYVTTESPQSSPGGL